MTAQPKLAVAQGMRTTVALQGRLTAVKWIAMTEPEVGHEVGELESDPLFKQLLTGSRGDRPVLTRRRWPASRLHPGFYELKESIASGAESGDIQDIVEKQTALISLIRRIGQGDFERYFLYGEEGRPLPEICEQLGISEEEGRRILDLVLEVGSRSEFFRPTPTSESAGIHYHCIARIEKDPRDEDNLYFQFLAPHWARGRYEVDYQKLEEWKNKKDLGSEERKRLRRLLNTVELLNMRQDTLFQILSRIVSTQSVYLRCRHGFRRRPLSLRELARRIGVAPSTVSRAVGRRSVELPWGEEIPLKALLCGQRAVVLSVLSHWFEIGAVAGKMTDDSLMRRLADETGISVSRRTINECRRKLLG
ncbi:MAG: hypothetical protein AAB576_08850 [Elusimicrobiota bacterium]